MTLLWVTSWWNLIFILPFGLALIYLGMYTLTGLSFGDADGDVGVDHDFDGHVEIDHDADVSHEVPVESDSDAEGRDAEAHDSESHNAGSASTSPSLFSAGLHWVGVGQIPLSLLLMIVMLSWGTIGFCANQFLIGRSILHMVVVSISTAGIGSFLLTHFASVILGKYLFSTENIARRRHELLGSRGEALYPIDAKFGMVCGRDDRGQLFQVACRVESGHEPLAKGAAVQLVAYKAEDRMFYVVPAEDAVTPRVTR